MLHHRRKERFVPPPSAHRWDSLRAAGIADGGDGEQDQRADAGEQGCNIQSIAILVGIDKFMSECRALTNLIGNGVACVVISISEGELDREALHETMAHPLEIGEALEPGGGA
jgi:hypothetical protein